MDLAQQKEQFSIAYVRAVVSVAGYAVYRPEVDDDSVDLGVALRGGAGTVRSPRLELQLKCTADKIWRNDPMNFPLKKKNYDDLRGDSLLVPRMLVVVCVPAKPAQWINQNEQRLLMRRCAYFLSLRTLPERTDVSSSVTVMIPQRQQFTATTLRDVMAMIGRGERP